MKFQKFAQYLNTIEETSGRNEMVDTVVDLLRDLPKEDIDSALYLMQGRVVPAFIDLEFNVAQKLMIRSLAKAFDCKEEKIKEKFSQMGDLGLVGEELDTQKSSSITVAEVHEKLYNIAAIEGKESQAGKVAGIAGILSALDALSVRYVVRIIIGNLRLGLSDKSILDALSIIAVGDKSKRKVFDKSYGARSDIGYIAEQLFKEGIEMIEDMHFVPGFPIGAMLCEREESFGKILERMGSAIIQPKYDGLRCQIHYGKNLSENLRYAIQKKEQSLIKDTHNSVKMFSRNLENLTNMFPDVVETITQLRAKSIILDSEIIGYDENTESFLPFQETIQRRRKYNVQKMKKDIPIKVFAYDLLFLNGKDISALPLSERLRKLKKVITNADQSIIKITPSDTVTRVSEAKKLFQKYVEEGLEGVIAKDPKSNYLPNKRGFEWIKYKKSSKGYMVDTVDAVVLGYYKGRGARAKFGIGALLIGVFNKKENRYESIAKVGTGIKDDEWKEIKNRLEEISIPKSRKNVLVKKELTPDVWVELEVVVEVEADEVTKSTNHTAGLANDTGYSLRFPRLKIFDRMDKSKEDITTVSEIKKMYTIGERGSNT